MCGFEQVVGHETVVARLRQSLETGAVGHAYIFDGEKGMGKKTLAHAFAKALECEVGGRDTSATPSRCGCVSCRVFDSGNHPDVHFVSATKTKSIGVDDVREQIIRPMSVKPFRYRYAIFIVDGAETLTIAAQNALLKTIEEPAPYGICMLLATRAQTLLPTVLSRCALLKLKPLPDTQVRQVLHHAGIANQKAAFCAAFARGNIGRALEMAESEDFEAMRTLAMDIVQRIRHTDVTGALALYRTMEKWKESMPSLLDMLYLCYRDMIIYKLDRKNLSSFALAGEACGTLADEMPMSTLFNGIDAITQTQKALRQNGNAQMAVEVLLLRLNGAYA